MAYYKKSVMDLGEGPGTPMQDPRAQELLAMRQLQEQSAARISGNALRERAMTLQAQQAADRLAFDRARMAASQQNFAKEIETRQAAEEMDRAFQEAMAQRGFDFRSQEAGVDRAFRGEQAAMGRETQTDLARRAEEAAMLRFAEQMGLQRESMGRADDRFAQEQAMRGQQFGQEMGLRREQFGLQQAQFGLQQQQAQQAARMEVGQILQGILGPEMDISTNPQETFKQLQVIASIRPDLSEAIGDAVSHPIFRQQLETLNPDKWNVTSLGFSAMLGSPYTDFNKALGGYRQVTGMGGR